MGGDALAQYRETLLNSVVGSLGELVESSGKDDVAGEEAELIRQRARKEAEEMREKGTEEAGDSRKRNRRALAEKRARQGSSGFAQSGSKALVQAAESASARQEELDILQQAEEEAREIENRAAAGGRSSGRSLISLGASIYKGWR